MSFIGKILKTYRNNMIKIRRKEKNKRLENNNFSIISSNCIGGLIYHDLGLKFLSPTINLYFEPKDFIKFCMNIKIYTKKEPTEYINNKYNYPTAKIDDILIHCVHYKSFNDFLVKWNERKQRINFENIFFIMTDRDGCTYEDIENFDGLSYKNKLIFVSKEMNQIKSAVFLPQFTEKIKGESKLKVLTNWKSFLSTKRILDDYDYISFLNKK